MFGSHLEDEFANNISSSAVAARGATYWPLLLVILTAIAAFGVWAYISELEEVTSGEGRVIPSGQTQVIQTLEGGIVRSLSVNEGDFVEAGQELVQIDDTSFSSRLGELKQQEFALLAERARLFAEASRAEEFNLPDDPSGINKTALLAEQELFQSRRSQLLNELRVLDNRLSQRNFELKELETQEAKLVGTLSPLEKEAKITERMVKRGVVPEIELLRLESRLAEIRGELAVNRSARPRIEASIDEAKNLIQTTKNNYTVNARERLAKLEVELAVIQETIKAASDRVTRATLSSPVRGIVNKINVTTIGAVIQPGNDIMEIVPVDDGLMIETKIRPQDVAFIKPNESASVKLTAYDYLIYGDLKGEVVRIGADTIADRDGEEFYQVIIRTEQNFLERGEKQYPIIPGMVATVDIKTGENTVLSYLMKPILRAREEALQ